VIYINKNELVDRQIYEILVSQMKKDLFSFHRDDFFT